MIIEGKELVYTGLIDKRSLIDTNFSNNILHISFNIDSNINDVVKEIMSSVNFLKSLPKVDDGIISFVGGVPLSHRGGKAANNGEYKSFKTDSTNSRAAGLWIWDRIQQLGKKRGMIAQAIREFRNSFDLHKLSLENADDSALRFYYKRTEECIQKLTVLPFTKR